MPPSRTSLDPEGHYDRLGLQPSATHTEIVAAFRSKARVLHPDVTRTGNAGAFVAVKQAYDVLSNRERRATYDREAQAAASNAAASRAAAPRAAPPRAAASNVTPEAVEPTMTARPPSSVPRAPTRPQRFYHVPMMLWVGLGAFLCLCVYQAVTHLLAPPRRVHDAIRPNAASVSPLSPSAHMAILYGPKPVRLAGIPNFYVLPAADPATLWRLDPERNALIPFGQLPSFSAVQAVRLIRQSGMLEVLLNDQGDGFISVDRLTPGNAVAARRAYCGYNAGPVPHDGELLDRHGFGGGRLEVENRAVQPAVVKLRDAAGAVAVSLFLGPGGHATFEGLPEGTFHTEFAVGELWSRACSSFAAGMRARRMDAALTLSGQPLLVVVPDTGEPDAVDIPDQVFERN